MSRAYRNVMDKGLVMSEKKFRAWDNVLNRMVYYDLESLRNGDANLNIIAPDGMDESKQMLFTGLKDKNKKEIYEGDVVNTAAIGDRLCPRIQRVISNPDCPGSLRFEPETGAMLSCKNQDIFEVIGNVHENPELKATV